MERHRFGRWHGIIYTKWNIHYKLNIPFRYSEINIMNSHIKQCLLFFWFVDETPFNCDLFLNYQGMEYFQECLDVSLL